MQESTPTQPLQEIPRTSEVSYIRLMQRIRASINHELPPLMVRTSHGILVAHQVSEDRVNDMPFWSGYIPSLIGYVGLGPEKYLMWLTIQHCFRGKWLVIRVPDPSAHEAYIRDFAKELHELQVRINKMPLPLIPLWMIFDIVTSGLTPPGNETLIGTIMTYVVAFLWSKKLRTILHKIKLGRVEFVTARICETLRCF